MRTEGTTAGSADVYRASRLGPIVAVLAFLLISLALFVLTAVFAFRTDIVVDDWSDVAVRVVATLFLGLGSLAVFIWSVRRLPNALTQRLWVDADGIHLRNADGFLELEWTDIRSIRLAVDMGQALGYRSPFLPAAIHRRAVTRLEFTLHDEEELEAMQPLLPTISLTRGKARFSTDGYSHALLILSGAFAPSLDINRYAPDLQRVLHNHAGSAFAGAVLRSF